MCCVHVCFVNHWQPLKLDVDRVLVGRSDRVKCVDIHPKETWILSALYNGNVFIWNYESEQIIRTFEVSEVPVRCAKFISRKNWLIVGSDDMCIRIYNYNTCEKIKEIEAHTDYIRSIAVHPTLPFVLSASDDMSIKLWDWDHNWDNTIIFEGHTHYVMQVEINPKDTNSFASASLDRTVKVWGLNSSVPHFQLEGHDRGVNCVSYYQGGERPFLVSGADDNLVKVWDYQTKTCIATLEGHSANISAVMFHPQLPIIISGSEDGSLKIWHSNTYRLETTLHYGMERVWTMACIQSSNKIAIGFDEGSIVIKLGQEEPIVSMDSSGKVIWARNHEIELTNVMRVSSKKNLVDGDPLALAPEDLESCEFYPNMIKHNKNGQLVAMCGDGEYTIKTALRLKTKSYGSAMEFVWSSVEPNVYATRQSASKVKIIRQFKDSESISVRPSYAIQGIFGGHLLGIKSSEFIDFYDWNDGRLIRRIEVVPKHVYWSESGQVVVLVCDDNFFVLNYNSEYVESCIVNNANVNEEEGYPNAFDLESDKSECVTSGTFSGDIFLYTNNACRLNYYIGGQVITLAHLDKAFYILGYLPRENRCYLIDKRYNIVSYQLLRHVLQYQAAIVRGESKKADSLLKKGKIPKDQFNKLAQFLENQGKPELALSVTQDCEHKFELALTLKKLSLAKEILVESPSEQKWKQLADLAMAECDFVTVEECGLKAKDLSLLLLLYSSTANKKGLLKVSEMAIEKGRLDIAFNTLFILGKIDKCIDLLVSNNRIPEASFMARSYHPKDLDSIQESWKKALNEISPAAAKSLGDRSSHPDAFPDASLSSTKQIENVASEQIVNDTAAQVQEQEQKQATVEKVETVESSEAQNNGIESRGRNNIDDSKQSTEISEVTQNSNETTVETSGVAEMDEMDEVDDGIDNISIPSGLDEDAGNDEDVNLDDEDFDFNLT